MSECEICAATLDASVPPGYDMSWEEWVVGLHDAEIARLKEENAELKRELAEARWALRAPSPRGAA